MKHLLNNMSSEEKNNIREQHTGGIKIGTSRFKSLLESTLGDAKPLVNENDPVAHVALVQILRTVHWPTLVVFPF